MTPAILVHNRDDVYEACALLSIDLEGYEDWADLVVRRICVEQVAMCNPDNDGMYILVHSEYSFEFECMCINEYKRRALCGADKLTKS